MAVSLSTTEDSSLEITYDQLIALVAGDTSSVTSLLISTVDSKKGTLTLNGTAIKAGTTKIVSTDTLVWTPAPGLTYDGQTDLALLSPFAFKTVVGTTVGKTATSVSITLDDANLAPVVSGTKIATYTENGKAVIVDSAISVKEFDWHLNGTAHVSQNLSSVTITIADTDLEDGDTLNFVANTKFGDLTIDSTDDGTGGVLTLSSANGVTAAQMQAAIKSITFSQINNDNPLVAEKGITIAVSDDTDMVGTLETSVKVTAVNDAPAFVGDNTGTDKAPAMTLENTVSEGQPYSITYNDLIDNFADAEGDTISFVISSIDAKKGKLEFSTDNGDTWSVASAGKTEITANTELRWTSTNVVNGETTGAEITPFTIKAKDDSGTKTALSKTAIGVKVTVDNVNMAPTLSVPASNTVQYTENQASVKIAPSIKVTDPDAGSKDALIQGAVVTIEDAQDGDTLIFKDTANLHGEYLDGELRISLQDGVTGVSAAEMTTALKTVSYFNGTMETDLDTGKTTYHYNDNPTAGDRVVTYTVTDSGPENDESIAVQTTLNIKAVNDAPIFDTETYPDGIELTGATELQQYTISHDDLAGYFTDPEEDGINILINTVDAAKGTLTLSDGTAVVAGKTVISSGDTLIWTPKSVSADTTVAAFTIKAQDDAATPAKSSTAVKVNIDVANDISQTEVTAGTTYYSFQIHPDYDTNPVQIEMLKITSSTKATWTDYVSQDGTAFESDGTGTLTLSNVTANGFIATQGDDSQTKVTFGPTSVVSSINGITLDAPLNKVTQTLETLKAATVDKIPSDWWEEENDEFSYLQSQTSITSVTDLKNALILDSNNQKVNLDYGNKIKGQLNSDGSVDVYQWSGSGDSYKETLLNTTGHWEISGAGKYLTVTADGIAEKGYKVGLGGIFKTDLDLVGHVEIKTFYSGSSLTSVADFEALVHNVYTDGTYEPDAAAAFFTTAGVDEYTFTEYNELHFNGTLQDITALPTNKTYSLGWGDVVFDANGIGTFENDYATVVKSGASASITFMPGTEYEATVNYKLLSSTANSYVLGLDSKEMALALNNDDFLVLGMIDEAHAVVKPISSTGSIDLYVPADWNPEWTHSTTLEPSAETQKLTIDSTNHKLVITCVDGSKISQDITIANNTASFDNTDAFGNTTHFDIQLLEPNTTASTVFMKVTTTSDGGTPTSELSVMGLGKSLFASSDSALVTEHTGGFDSEWNGLSDVIVGSDGMDNFYGGDGDDIMIAGSGADKVQDIFFYSGYSGEGNDTIYNFDPLHDKIAIDQIRLGSSDYYSTNVTVEQSAGNTLVTLDSMDDSADTVITLVGVDAQAITADTFGIQQI